ncbi:hypothetical protein HAX54_031498 [Datura stramonium]|uniref:Uncharacterized protein n=1 Tax=Datura stramonium TaxID=4076 RepID=A0ABS8VAD6_DATST|nr:hypothetical protein [Datura stramonium]
MVQRGSHKNELKKLGLGLLKYSLKLEIPFLPLNFSPKRPAPRRGTDRADIVACRVPKKAASRLLWNWEAGASRQAVCLPYCRVARLEVPRLLAPHVVHRAAVPLPRVVGRVVWQVFASSFDICIIHSNFFTCGFAPAVALGGRRLAPGSMPSLLPCRAKTVGASRGALRCSAFASRSWSRGVASVRFNL